MTNSPQPVLRKGSTDIIVYTTAYVPTTAVHIPTREIIYVSEEEDLNRHLKLLSISHALLVRGSSAVRSVEFESRTRCF